MRIVVFQGQSNYDVLRDLSRFTADGFRQWGHDVFLCDMNWVNGLDYIRAVHEFKPDFTLGYNPICYWFNGRTHFEATGIPHFVQLGDSPFYHVTERALTEPDHPLVYTLLNETSFLQQMKEIGVKNFRRVKTYQAVSAFKESNHNYRSFPIVFFGSLFPYEAEIKNIQSIFDGQLRDILLEFLSFLPEWMNHNGVFLPVPIDQFFNSCVDMKLEDQYRFDFMKMIYPFIDRYYRYYTRSFVLEQFAKSGLPLMVFGDEHTKTLLSEYPNVKVFSPVPFRECLEIYAQSKIVLNISPSFFYAHERISQSMINGAVLCSSLAPDLIEEIPELLETSLFYTWGNIGEVIESAAQVLNNESQRQEMADRGRILAKQHFSPMKYADEVLSIYKDIYLQ